MDSAQQASNALGEERIGKLLFRLAAPAILAQIINALYNVVDKAYIGHLPDIGGYALTGLGLCFPIIMIISAFAALLGMGGAPLAAIKMGEGKNEQAERILGNCLSSLVIVSVLLTGAFMAFHRPILMLFGASENTLGYAGDYLMIYLAGTVFVQVSLGMNSFINTQGFAKTGMLTVAIGAVCNILLDPLFIFVFNMGVRGAALATIISQAVSTAWVLAFLFGKKTVLKMRVKNLLPSFRVMGPVMALGVSPFVMQATESAIYIVFNSQLKYYGGDDAVGAMSIISSMMQMLMMPLLGLCQGAQPIISYNYGARKLDRVRKAYKTLLVTALTGSTAIWLVLILVPQALILIFNKEERLLTATISATRIFMAGVFALGAQNACQQTFLALGQAKISLMLALLRKVVLLIPLVFILGPFLGTTGVYLAEPMADMIASTVTVIVFAVFYRRVLRQRVELQE